MSSPLPLLLACLSLLVAACSAGNYDALMDRLEKRNRHLHSRYLQQLGVDQPNFFDQLDSRVSDLQAKHYVRDAQYSNSFDLDKYWADLVDRPAEVDEETAVLRELADAGVPPPVSDRRNEAAHVNTIWGDQHVSGGAGKDGQVTGPNDRPQAQKVKTDRLPSYCDPPNPCPIGVDPAKLSAPCSSDVDDNAEFNYADTVSKMATQQCPCDSEHMRCPKLTESVTAKRSKQPTNPYLVGGKNDKVDSKKSPKFAISKRGVKANFKSTVMTKKNPWLDNEDALETVEKKAGKGIWDRRIDFD